LGEGISGTNKQRNKEKKNLQARVTFFSPNINICQITGPLTVLASKVVEGYRLASNLATNCASVVGSWENLGELGQNYGYLQTG